jgi:hypothetical protein
VRLVRGSDDWAVGADDLLRWRRRVRQWTAAAHAAGLLVPGAMMLAAEGAAAPPLSRSGSLIMAWAGLSVTIGCCFWQAVALAAWSRVARVLRVAEGPRRGGGALMMCGVMFMITVWAAEVGYAGQAVASIGSGGWSGTPCGLLVGMLGLGELTGPSAVFVGACALLDRLVRAVRDRRRIRGAVLPSLGRRAGGVISGDRGQL